MVNMSSHPMVASCDMHGILQSFYAPDQIKEVMIWSSKTILRSEHDMLEDNWTR